MLASTEPKSRILGRGVIDVSFEFSPPKTPEAEETLWQAIRRLEPLGPRFVSVTYGAGGSTRERTHRTVARMLRRDDAEARRPPDLRRRHAATRSTRSSATIGTPASAISWRCAATRRAARRALSRRTPTATPTPPNWPRGINSIAPFEISVACYPQMHPESPSLEHDIDVLKAKIDAGATRAISQFFFDIEAFLRFIDQVRARGDHHPDRAGHHAGHQLQAGLKDGRDLLGHERAGLARATVRGARRRSGDAPAGRRLGRGRDVRAAGG